MISFNGRSSDDFRVIVEEYPPRPVPKRKTTRWSVPGLSGDVIAPEDAWENVKRSYKVYLSAEGPKLPAVAREAVGWLMAPGYHELWDEYDLDTYTMATYLGGAEIQNIDNEFGRLTLTFDCWPERFLRIGSEPVSVASGATLVNPTVYTARPFIIARGAGAGALTVNGATLTLTDCDGVELDCREREATRSGLSLNQSVSGTYPTLAPGENSITLSGGMRSLTIIPRWFVL